MTYLLLGWLVVSCVLALAAGRLLRGESRHGLSREQRVFLDRFTTRLRTHHPEVEVRARTPGEFGIILAVDGQEVAIPVRDAFAHAQAFPTRFDDMVVHIVRELRERLAQVGDAPFDEVFDRILPQIRPEKWIARNSPAFGAARIVNQPLMDDLRVCYVIDEPGAMVFVTDGHLKLWNKSVKDLDSLAMQNLDKMVKEEGGVPLPSAEEPLILRTGDGYDAAKILLAPKMIERDSAQGLVFAIPDRDTLWVGRQAPAAAQGAQLLACVKEVHDHSVHPVSDALFRVTPTGLQKLMSLES